jgi:hypothetical protein
MRKVLLLCLIIMALSLAGFSVPVAEASDKVAWEGTFEAAKARAEREGKPILFMHLFGRLNEELA